MTTEQLAKDIVMLWGPALTSDTDPQRKVEVTYTDLVRLASAALTDWRNPVSMAHGEAVHFRAVNKAFQTARAYSLSESASADERLMASAIAKDIEALL